MLADFARLGWKNGKLLKVTGTDNHIHMLEDSRAPGASLEFFPPFRFLSPSHWAFLDDALFCKDTPAGQTPIVSIAALHGELGTNVSEHVGAMPTVVSRGYTERRSGLTDSTLTMTYEGPAHLSTFDHPVPLQAFDPMTASEDGLTQRSPLRTCALLVFVRYQHSVTSVCPLSYIAHRSLSLWPHKGDPSSGGIPAQSVVSLSGTHDDSVPS